MSIGSTLGGVWADLDVRTLTDNEVLEKSSGEVLKPETINYRTFRPERDGLFDVDIFGDRDELTELLASGMDVDWGAARITSAFGHIELAQPIVHPYFATHGIAELAEACGWMSSQVRAVLGHEVVVFEGQMVPLQEAPDPEVVQYGAGAIANVLSKPDDFTVQRLLVAPIATRPMVDLSDGRFATSNVTDLYRRVVNRNNRLRRLLELNAPAIINMNEQRMLQEAAVSLCFNGFEESKTITGPDRVPLIGLFELAQRDAEFVTDALGGTGPARGVRAIRAFEAIGFNLVRGAEERVEPAGSKNDFSLVDAPVPIPEAD